MRRWGGESERGEGWGEYNVEMSMNGATSVIMTTVLLLLTLLCK